MKRNVFQQNCVQFYISLNLFFFLLSTPQKKTPAFEGAHCFTQLFPWNHWNLKKRRIPGGSCRPLHWTRWRRRQNLQWFAHGHCWSRPRGLAQTANSESEMFGQNLLGWSYMKSWTLLKASILRLRRGNRTWSTRLVSLDRGGDQTLTVMRTLKFLISMRFHFLPCEWLYIFFKTLSELQAHPNTCLNWLN